MSGIASTLAEAVGLHQSGRFKPAERLYRRILEREPNNSDALHLLGVLTHQQGDFATAVLHIRRAIAIEPKSAEYRNNLAAALRAMGRLDEAIESCRQAIGLDPQYAEAYYNLGELYKECEDWGRSCEAYGSAMRLRPECITTALALGRALLTAGRYEDAQVCFERSLKQEPGNDEIRLELATALKRQDRMSESVAAFRRSTRKLSADPLRELWLASLCPSVFASADELAVYRCKLLATLERLSYRRVRLTASQIEQRCCPPPYELQYHGLDDLPLKRAYTHLFRQSAPPRRSKRHSDRPRVGFVVTGGHEWTFLRCMRGIVERLDAELGEISLVSTASGAKLLGDALHNSAVSTLVIPDRLEQAIEVVSAANFDVLFYWEVGSDITNYFLPFFRAAPIQCTGWGVPVTSGIPQMDYFLSSKLVEPPEADRHYSEQLIQARTLLTWQERVRIPDHPKSRESFGFSRSRNLYVCVQQTRKIHPDFDPMLAGILRNDPRATVVIVEDSRKQTAHRLRERFSRTLADVIERVVFLPQLSVLDYLALLNEADVLLDTPHFGGGITTYDGLSLNKPIVTLPSGFRRGRFATACYLMMGVLDCVSESADDYVATAVELAANRDWRAHVESRIQETSSVLFENNQAVREFERILLRLIAAARRSPIQDRTIGAA